MPTEQNGSMPTSGSKYSSNPMIGENGMATYNSSSYSPNRVGARRETAGGTPITPGPGGEQLPIGDCPIELLIAFALICVVTIKIRSNKCKLVESTSTNG